MVAAAVAPERVPMLRALLATLNTVPGVIDPGNALLPFGAFETLHFARLVVVDDPTQGDIAAHGVAPRNLPVYLAFIGDCDGPVAAFYATLVARAHEGVVRLFAHCSDFGAEARSAAGLLAWLLAHEQPAAAAYVNWVGRTVQQIGEERALQQALSHQLPQVLRDSDGNLQAARENLVAYAQGEQRAGRLTLTATPPTPWRWQWDRWADALGTALSALLLLPFALVALPFYGWRLRRHEARDPELAGRPDDPRVRALAASEDHDVSNPFTAVGAVKPGVLRWVTVRLALAFLTFACRHIYTRGHLTRVQTIHFARWSLLDGGQRLLFASNYDGSLESYMDDFINKVGWGLNLVFSNGVGYPRTRWLVEGGALREQRFKAYLRRHELQTDAWYKAYPGLTTLDLARNSRIRQGLERGPMSDAQTLTWLRLL